MERGIVSRLIYLAFGLVLVVKGVGIAWTTNEGFFSVESALGSLLIAVAVILFEVTRE